MQKHWLLLSLLLCGALLGGAASAKADPVKRAKKLYLQGQRYMDKKKYSRARSAFARAYKIVPLHPHFRCVRVNILFLKGQAERKMGRPYAAMRTYYKAYNIPCKSKGTRNRAMARYRRLYRRYMCSVKLITTPPKARVLLNFKQVGHTPWKKVLMPGTYKFKIRMYDYKSVWLTLKLKAGQHVVKRYKMVKGDDPVNRPEKVDVAPPPPVNNRAVATRGGNSKIPEPPVRRKKRTMSFGNAGAVNKGGKGLLGGGGGGDDLNPLNPNKPKKVKPAGPFYAQAWFWVVVGVVVVGTTTVAILVPKDQQVLLTQGSLF